MAGGVSQFDRGSARSIRVPMIWSRGEIIVGDGSGNVGFILDTLSWKPSPLSSLCKVISGVYNFMSEKGIHKDSLLFCFGHFFVFKERIRLASEIWESGWSFCVSG